MSRSSRLLSLLQTLSVRRKPITALRLAEQLGVSERTIYRDLAELSSQGARIEGATGVGYLMRVGFFLPPLMLNEEEAEAVLLGLDLVSQRGDEVLIRAGINARSKIKSVLAHVPATSNATPMVTTGPPLTGFPDNTVSLARLRSAIRAHDRLEITYKDESDNVSTRTAWPLQLSFLHNSRVLISWCELRGSLRTFRTDRILSAIKRDCYPGDREALLRRFRIENSLDLQDV